MFIDYGVNKDGELVYIGQALRGKTELACPYCGGLLTAKKGPVKLPHFAHSGVTCAATDRDQDAISLPAYDKFDLYLPGKVVVALRRFAEDDSWQHRELLEEHGLIKANEFNRRSGYELTHKGKIPLGQLSLDLFNQFQACLFAERHAALEAIAERRYRMIGVQTTIDDLTAEIERLSTQLGIEPNQSTYLPSVSPDLRAAYLRRRDAIIERQSLIAHLPPISEQRLGLPVALADLQLYRAQWRRVRSATLYFLSINDGQYHKVGVTSRTIEERLVEIATDLVPLIGTPKIEVVGTWPQRGNVELYFKFRYRDQQVKLGDLTEYFHFDDPAPVVRDLRRMKPTPPTDLETAILAGQLSAIEDTIRREAIEVKRRAGIRAGMRRTANQGKSIGRPPGADSDQALLSKYPRVVNALRDGLSLRQAATRCSVAVNTVRKVQAVLKRTPALERMTD